MRRPGSGTRWGLPATSRGVHGGHPGSLNRRAEGRYRAGFVNALLALGSLLATATCLAVLVWLHVLPTGYRPIRNAVSDYGVGRFAHLYRAQTAASAIAALLLAGALSGGVDPTPILVVFLLLVFAAARLLIPWYPTDLDRAQPTRTGRIHVLLAGLAFGSIAWASASLPDRVDWPGVHGTLVALGWAVVVLAVGCGLCMSRALHQATEPFFGLVERLFYAAMLTWLALVAVQLL